MSSQVDRLAAQLALSQRRDGELLQHNRRLAQTAAEHQTAIDKGKALQQEREKLTVLKEKLEEQRDQVVADLKAIMDLDEKERKKLSDELSVIIASVNEEVETENKCWSDVVHRNAALKEKITILKENMNAGSEKFNDLAIFRDKEGEAMRQRLQDVLDTNEKLKERDIDLDALIEKNRGRHSELREKAEKFIDEFKAVQKQLSDANQHFTQSKQEQDRLNKRVTVTENEAIEMRKRLVKTLAERDADAEQLSQIKQQISTVEAQSLKLGNLTKAIHDKLETN